MFFSLRKDTIADEKNILVSLIKTFLRTVFNESDILKSIRNRGLITMSRQRRSFSAKFKSDLVIELLKGEKVLNISATENNIQPNLLRNWKKEFLNNASVVFDDKPEENFKGKLAEEQKELKTKRSCFER